MKKLFLFTTTAILLSINSLNAQTILNGETNNIEEYNYLCWQIPKSINNSENEKLFISGKYSFETTPVNTNLLTDTYIKSPWLTNGIGNVKLTARLNGSGAKSRGVVFSYAFFDEASKNEDYTTDFNTFYEYSFTNMSNTNTTIISSALPMAIKNTNQPYKIRISFVGTDGEGTIVFDDVEISGRYSSDPSNKCLPAKTSEENDKEDDDKDKVANKYDLYPNDPIKAYNNYYPENSNGTIMFEDLWPSKGDYDFNDLVVGYRFNIVTDAENNIVEINYEITPKAIGAGFNNGFGFMLNKIEWDKIYAVEGLKTEAKWLNLNKNGTEADQKIATIIAFTSAADFLKGPGGSTGVNVDPKVAYVTPQTINFTVKFRDENGKAPNGFVSMKEFSVEDFNPFAIINQNRETEIHLPGYEPTAKADRKMFGQFDDNSSEGNYYKSKDNLPWALNIPAEIPYATEKTDFVKGYKYFAEWARTKGENYRDWYEENEKNRDNDALYIVK
ncbi:MAG: LruC domain-containing protein [Candidatus Methylacidiphilales bacterium]